MLLCWRICRTRSYRRWPISPARPWRASGDERGRRNGGDAGDVVAEITEIAGPKGKHNQHRVAVRHGSEKGSVTLDGQRISVSRPRARTTNGHEVSFNSYAQFAAEDRLTRVVIERMLAGLATCRHAPAPPRRSKRPRTSRSRRRSPRFHAGSSSRPRPCGPNWWPRDVRPPPPRPAPLAPPANQPRQQNVNVNLQSLDRVRDRVHAADPHEARFV
jgi:hypothetical protein